MLNVAMVLGDAETIEMVIEEDIGIAFVSRSAAARGLEVGRVDGVDLYRKIYLARSRQFPSTRSQLEFWESVKSHNRERVKTRLGE